MCKCKFNSTISANILRTKENIHREYFGTSQVHRLVLILFQRCGKNPKYNPNFLCFSNKIQASQDELLNFSFCKVSFQSYQNLGTKGKMQSIFWPLIRVSPLIEWTICSSIRWVKTYQSSYYYPILQLEHFNC